MALRGAALASGLAALSWIVAAVICANRGLDLTDESFYLLSYRWWNDNFDSFSGVQYVYGPVFELLGFDIARLRLVRLATTVAAHVWFGWTFMSWLRWQRPAAPASRWWEIAGTATITACAGITYSWLPLSPGYNDLALTCAFVLAGGVLWIARDILADRPAAAWVPLGMGATAVVMGLAKWSSAALVLVGVATVLLVLHFSARQGWLRLGRLVGLGVAGMLGTAAFVQFALVPFQKIVPPMLEVNSMVADSTNSPAALLTRYRIGGEILLDDVVAQHWLLLLVAVAVPFLARWPRIALALVLLALASSIAQVVRHDGTIAGPPHLMPLTVTIFAPLLAILLVAITALVAALPRRWRSVPDQASGGAVRRGAPRSVIVIMLVVLPVAVSMGTGNLLQYMAMLGLAAWVAVAILIATAEPARHLATRVLILGAVSGIVVATMFVAVDGLWNRPYRTSGFEASTTRAKEVPALDSLRLAPDDAEEYADLRQRLLPYVEEEGRAMMAFDAMSGLVFLLDGRPVGEAWYAPSDTARSTAGVIRTCDDDRWWGQREPIVLFNRPVTKLERKTLRHCGIRLAHYVQLTEHIGDQTVVIYLPPGPSSGDHDPPE
ncbi:hypothetical protein ASD81_19760 [Nocardioides sp. Root614]|nr:hypothetical protein ASD81_19760 [Nocardioides sp. Root614]KRA86857.1 hypothetical protein ASD84_21975 [Nocardioides sp. Root682]